MAEKIVDNSYYGLQDSNFRNSLYCLNEAVESYYANLLFKGDTSRIIVSKNNFALRKRALNDDVNSLNLPFMNYKMKAMQTKTTRPWFNYMSNIDGIYVPELNRKLRMSPITIDYECTLWFKRSDDVNYAYQLLTYDSDVETKITYYIKVLNEELPLISVVNYNLQLDPTYDEQEWLEKNKIHTIVVDFSIETFFIKDNLDICVPESIIFEFQTKNSLDEISSEETYQLMINKYEESVNLE
jgi:hypothetical protein